MIPYAGQSADEGNLKAVAAALRARAYKSRRYGLKTWSINLDMIDEIAKSYDEGFFQYIELYAVPGSFDESAHLWKALAHIPFIIHGVHSGHQVNWAVPDKFDYNREKARDSFRFADQFKADTIIFHPGFMGTADETIRQLKLFGDQRIVIENKPHYALDHNVLFRGSTSAEMAMICDGTGYGCCIDIGHAMCAAAARGEDGYALIKELLTLDYRVIHFSDGAADSVHDQHLHIGDGGYDFARVLKMIEKDVYLTLETPKGPLTGLKNDIRILRRLEER